MAESDLTVSNGDRSAEDWEQGTTTRVPGNEVSGPFGGSWLGARLETALARLTSRFSRRPKDDDGEESTALVRTGGALARWISFPRGVRSATAATSAAAAGLAAWGMLAVAANDLGIAAAAAGAAAALSTACGSRAASTGSSPGAGWCASWSYGGFRIAVRSPCAASSSRAGPRPRRWTGARPSGR
jgi:hypothetical protein